MITNFKIFEKINSVTDKFLYDYNQPYNKIRHDLCIEISKEIKVPDSFIDEFSMLFFMYQYPFLWKTDDNRINKKTQREIKKYALASAWKKIEDDLSLYDTVVKFIKKHKIYQDTGPIQYAMYLFLNIENNKPPLITAAEKFNL